MYKQDLALNNPQWLISLKHNQLIYNLFHFRIIYIYIYIYIYIHDISTLVGWYVMKPNQADPTVYLSKYLSSLLSIYQSSYFILYQAW